MSSFTFDTSGEVAIPAIIAMTGEPDTIALTWRWGDLSPFAQGYVEAALADALPLFNIATPPRFTTLAPEALAMILHDCEVYERHHPMKPFAEYRRARGSAFWTERNSGKRTSDWAPVHFYPVAACLGDDGKVCLAPTTQDGGA